ncbi:tryptophan synthase subunit alpha [Escherichia coli]|uniref:tryptophan synthase subunit alpha n=1 Tax=Escherichia coli TaxID=562 RepID=UPI00388F5911
MIHLFIVTCGRDRRRKPRRVTLNHLVTKLKEYNAAPPLQGFGISAPDQVKAAIDAGAAGAISGSAIVKIIEQHINEPEKMPAAVGKLCTTDERRRCS